MLGGHRRGAAHRRAKTFAAWRRRSRAVVLRAVLTGILAAAASGGADTWEQVTWEQATWYRATFSAPVGGSARLHVAAVDSYTVYLNGTRVGGDTTWTRLNAFRVALADGDNELALAVVNRGRGDGHGVLAFLEADSLDVATTTDRSRLQWRWTTSAPAGTGWRTEAPGDDWQAVQNGRLDTARIAGDIPAGVEVVAGYGGGMDIGDADGGVRLKGVQGENLALDKPANRVETVDGDLTTAWEPPVASLNFTASVDLRERFLVRKVRVLTKGPAYEANSLRGYSVQVSDDQVRWSEVASLHEITDYVRTEVEFTPTWTRFVRIVIVEINAITQPKVAEVEVYADGYTERGSYLSEPLRLDDAGARKNLGRVEWDATVPARTEMTVQFRAADSSADLDDPDAGWSPELSAGGVWFPATEPARWVQYRVNMETRDELRTPVFRRLRIDHDAADLPARGATAWVTPNQMPMGADTTFVYTVDLDVGAGDLGVERLQIQVPAAAVVDPQAVEGADVAAWTSSHDRLTLTFAEPLSADTRLRIPLRTRTWSNLHTFAAFLFSPGSDNPLNVSPATSTDPLTGQPRSWDLLATTAVPAALSQVRAAPPVVTPNGDGINDDTVIEFILAKVDVPRRVRLRIYDLSGRTVADLGTFQLPSGAYLRSDAGGGDRSPGLWDGTDGAGTPVPPGHYIYRIEVDLDSGAEVRTGLVGVAY